MPLRPRPTVGMRELCRCFSAGSALRPVQILIEKARLLAMTDSLKPAKMRCVGLAASLQRILDEGSTTWCPEVPCSQSALHRRAG
jgi:hypothetical protein